jgi:hypothetical protein
MNKTGARSINMMMKSSGAKGGALSAVSGAAPLAFQDRMRLGKAAKLARKVRGVARVSAVVPKATRSALDTMATAEAQPSAYKEQLMTNALHASSIFSEIEG